MKKWSRMLLLLLSWLPSRSHLAEPSQKVWPNRRMLHRQRLRVLPLRITTQTAVTPTEAAKETSMRVPTVIATLAPIDIGTPPVQMITKLQELTLSTCRGGTCDPKSYALTSGTLPDVSQLIPDAIKRQA